MFGNKAASQPADDKPAGKHDLSSLFKRKPKDEPAVSGRRSVLADAASAPEPAAQDDANPFRPMAVGAAGSRTYSLDSEVEYCGFWLRFAAAFIDNILGTVAVMLVAAIAGLLFGMTVALSGGERETIAGTSTLLGFVLGFVLPWIYFAMFESSAWQATPGKRLLGMQVTTLDGERIGFWRASGRYWGKILSSILFFIGYLMQPFTKRKQALHDLMASTLVVRT